MERICQVLIERFAEKQLKRIPVPIRGALRIWAETIELSGVNAMRRLAGYRDEPLKGGRAGQRSARLSRSYRIFYEEREKGEILVIAVLEVNKHDY